eukprot:gene13285-biopygen3599
MSARMVFATRIELDVRKLPRIGSFDSSSIVVANAFSRVLQAETVSVGVVCLSFCSFCLEQQNNFNLTLSAEQQEDSHVSLAMYDIEKGPLSSSSSSSSSMKLWIPVSTRTRVH